MLPSDGKLCARCGRPPGGCGHDESRDPHEEWIRQVCELLRPIAEWEDKNGTASALVGYEEQARIGTIIQKWARTHSARRLLEAV